VLLENGEGFDVAVQIISAAYLRRTSENVIFRAQRVDVSATYGGRLVADLGEGVLRGRTGDQLGPAQNGEIVGHLFVHAAIECLDNMLQIHVEVSILVGVGRS
jgi:hypothetical protein